MRTIKILAIAGVVVTMTIAAVLPASAKTKKYTVIHSEASASTDVSAPEKMTPKEKAESGSSSSMIAYNLDEIQKGDNKLTCKQLMTQLTKTNEIAAKGSAALKVQKAADNHPDSVVSKVSNSKTTRSVASGALGFLGPIGMVAGGVIKSQQAKDEPLKQAAKTRHDRLLTLYDRKNCTS